MLQTILLVLATQAGDCAAGTTAAMEASESRCLDAEHRLHGEAVLRQAGVVRRIRVYDHGIATGTWKTFFSDGKLQSQETYDAGERNGPRILLHKDGSIFQLGGYAHGARDGVWIEKSPTGEIIWLGRYQHGFPVGVFEYQGKKPIAFVFDGRCSRAPGEVERCTPDVL